MPIGLLRVLALAALFSAAGLPSCAFAQGANRAKLGGTVVERPPVERPQPFEVKAFRV